MKWEKQRDQRMRQQIKENRFRLVENTFNFRDLRISWLLKVMSY